VTSGALKDLQDAIKARSVSGRASALAGVTKLLLLQGERMSDEQIALFDAILMSFVDVCETGALTDLSRALAPKDYAPQATLKHLAFHPDIRIAGPVLTSSPRLSSDDLIEAAAAHGQDHLMAIAQRKALGEALCDVLIELGDRDVRYSVAANEGANISPASYRLLVQTADGDARMTEKTALRADVPPQLLARLLRNSSHAVRARLLAKTPLHQRMTMQEAIGAAEKHDEQEAERPRDLGTAEEVVHSLKKAGQLTETKVMEFAELRQQETLVMALAMLAASPVELIRPLMRSNRSDGLIVACRAAELGWDTTRAVILSRLKTTADACEAFRKSYDETSVAIAKRTLNIWKGQALGTRRFAT
jgi:uncharacterized protein (DUF2336 family)